MAYRDRTGCNWGAVATTALAVPSIALWMLVEWVGGALACEGVDGPCGPSVLGVLGGLAAILAAAISVGWLLDRVIGWATNGRN